MKEVIEKEYRRERIRREKIKGICVREYRRYVLVNVLVNALITPYINN